MGSFVVSNRDRDPPCTNCTGRGRKLGLLDGTRWHPPPMVSRLRVIDGIGLLGLGWCRSLLKDGGQKGSGIRQGPLYSNATISASSLSTRSSPPPPLSILGPDPSSGSPSPKRAL